MKLRGVASALVTLLAFASWASAAEAPGLHASATCAPASKPGRIRCRAVLELPLDDVGKTRIAWGELRVLSGDPAVTPLRGRLGPLDAELRDDARVAWSFSVAAATPGAHTMHLRLLATLAAGASGPPHLVERRLEVPIEVAAP